MGKVIAKAIEWIHPSWRDLLIEHLGDHPGDRRAFLNRCGVPGILLALSRAGGSTGKREFPLLIDAEDWRLLADAICRNLSVASTWETHQLSDAVSDALRHAGSESEKARTVQLENLAISYLNASRTMWDQAQKPIFLYALRVYYELTTLVRPLLSGPQLSATWLASWTRVDMMIANNVTTPEELTANIMSTIELALLIRQNEPRFLTQLSYPAAYVDTVTRWLDRCEIDLRADPTLKDEPEFADRHSHLSDVGKVLHAVAAQFSALENRAQRMAVAFDKKADALLDKMSSMFRETPEDDSENSAIDPSEFNIVAVFKDL